VRRILRSVAAVGVVALAVAAPASAAITESHVTTPSRPFFAQVDRDNPQLLHVAGTTTGGSPGDKVDIACVKGGGEVKAVFGDPQPIDGSGKFAADVLVEGLFSSTACEIEALPDSASAGDPPGSDHAHFTGPRANFGQRDIIRRSDDPSSPVSSVLLGTQKPAGEWEHFQTGSCTITDALLTQPGTLLESDLPFWCNAWLGTSNEGDSPGTRSQLVIDKANAYLPDAAAVVNPDAPHLPPLVITDTYSTQNGDLIVHSTEPAVKCKPDTSFPTSPAKCADFVPLGVSVETSITDRSLGTISRVAQKFVSTDGHKHALDLLFDNETHSHGRNAGVRFPWVDSRYKAHGSAATVVGPPTAGPGALFVKSDRNAPDGTLAGVQGSIVFSSAPRRVQFIRATDSAVQFTDFELVYKRTVTPKAPKWFGWTLGLGTRAAVLNKSARKEQRAFRPRVQIKKPAKGASTRRRKVTVTGTSHDASGRLKVRVNGHRAKVRKSGSWRVKVQLKRGRNTLTARATNRYGNSARAHRTVVRRRR
jgi:hypothetical protein